MKEVLQISNFQTHLYSKHFGATAVSVKPKFLVSLEMEFADVSVPSSAENKAIESCGGPVLMETGESDDDLPDLDLSADDVTNSDDDFQLVR